MSEYFKEAFFTPFLEHSRLDREARLVTDEREREARLVTNEREAAIAERDLARKHELNMRLAIVIGILTLIVVVGSLALLFIGKHTEGMWVFSTVLAIGGSGGMVFGFTRGRRS